MPVTYCCITTTYPKTQWLQLTTTLYYTMCLQVRTIVGWGQVGNSCVPQGMTGVTYSLGAVLVQGVRPVFTDVFGLWVQMAERKHASDRRVEGLYMGPLV